MNGIDGIDLLRALAIPQLERERQVGIETWRQRSDLAINRMTPALLGQLSLVTLFAHPLLQGQTLLARQAAWHTMFTVAVHQLSARHQSVAWTVPARPASTSTGPPTRTAY